MKKSKKPFVTRDEMTEAFDYAFKGEMQRCLTSGMLGYFEFGTEFLVPIKSRLPHQAASHQLNDPKDEK